MEKIEIERKLNKMPAGNIRYISGGRDTQLERFTIPIKVLNGRKGSSS